MITIRYLFKAASLGSYLTYLLSFLQKFISLIITEKSSKFGNLSSDNTVDTWSLEITLFTQLCAVKNFILGWTQ